MVDGDTPVDLRLSTISTVITVIAVIELYLANSFSIFCLVASLLATVEIRDRLCTFCSYSKYLHVYLQYVGPAGVYRETDRQINKRHAFAFCVSTKEGANCKIPLIAPPFILVYNDHAEFSFNSLKILQTQLLLLI